MRLKNGNTTNNLVLKIMSDFEMVNKMEKEGYDKDLNHFKLRAECLYDVLLLIHRMPENMCNMKIIQVGQLPDVVMEFKTTLTLDEIMAILSNQVDSHVMMETLRPFDEYTGKRCFIPNNHKSRRQK